MPIDPAYFRRKLLDLRERLRSEEAASATDRAPVALDQESVGRLSRMDAMQVQAMAMAAQRRREQEHTAIDAALRRIDEDEFGYCLKCGDEIAPARLEKLPTVTTCIDCARGT